MKVQWVEIENIKSFKDRTRINLNPEHNFVVGTNGSGKTTMLQVLASCMLTLIPTYTIQNEGHGGGGSNTVTKYGIHPSLPSVILPKNYARQKDAQTIKMLISFENSWTDLLLEVDSYLKLFKKHAEYLDVSFWDAPNHNGEMQRVYDLLKDRTDLDFEFEFEIIEPNENTQTLKLTDESYKENESILVMLEKIEVQRIYYNQLFRAGKVNEVVAKGLQVIYLSADRSLGFPRSINLNRNSPQEYTQNNAYTRKANMMSSLFGDNSSFDYITQTLTRLAEAVIYQIWVVKRANPLAAVPEYKKLKKYTKDLLGFEFRIEIPGSPYEDLGVYFMDKGHEVLFNQLSSGERSLIYFIFTLINPDIKNSFILIDEAEIHLHGNMQDVLLEILFKGKDLNNQHFVSTHSPKLINTITISHVLRFFKRDNISHHINFRTNAKLGDEYDIVRLINGQNNEKVFFADKVVLVEGISDRILVERLIKALGVSKEVIEVIDVGGKSNFVLYRNYLNEVQVPNFILADFDHLHDKAKAKLGGLYVVDKAKVARKIFKKDSIDGQTLLKLIEQYIQDDKKTELQELLAYIYASNSTLKTGLTANEKSLLKRVRDKFMEDRYYIHLRGITINRRKYTGEIEDYLTHIGSVRKKGKLIQALVNYVEREDFLKDFTKRNDKRLLKELMTFLADVLLDDKTKADELIEKAKS